MYLTPKVGLEKSRKTNGAHSTSGFFHFINTFIASSISSIGMEV